MLIDTGDHVATARSVMVESGQSIRHVDGARAERECRKIIAAIWTHETEADLDAYMAAESLSIDALHLFSPFLSAQIDAAAEEVRHSLIGGRDCASRLSDAKPASSNALRGKSEKRRMIDIDTGETSSGPFINWKAQRKEFELRVSKDDKRSVDAFTRGVVLDLENLRIGWQHSEYALGKAPSWTWWPTPNSRVEKPSDDHKWGMSLPCAIGDGEVAVWEQAGAAVQAAIVHLKPQLDAAPGGKLPVVKLSGVAEKRFNVGSTTYPQLAVVKWVDRPDCLKGGAQGRINTDETASIEPAPEPEEVEF